MGVSDAEFIQMEKFNLLFFMRYSGWKLFMWWASYFFYSLLQNRRRHNTVRRYLRGLNSSDVTHFNNVNTTHISNGGITTWNRLINVATISLFSMLNYKFAICQVNVARSVGWVLFITLQVLMTVFFSCNEWESQRWKITIKKFYITIIALLPCSMRCAQLNLCE
jgi:hypothetical protein